MKSPFFMMKSANSHVFWGRTEDEGLGRAFDVAAGVATTIVYGLAFFGKHRAGAFWGAANPWKSVGNIWKTGKSMEKCRKSMENSRKSMENCRKSMENSRTWVNFHRDSPDFHQILVIFGVN